MTHSESTNIEALIAEHLNGSQPNVPESKREAFEQALAAHLAMKNTVDETVEHGEVDNERRLPPELPSDYTIQREIGKGGMGVVYLVHQRSLDRDVALKVLRPGEHAIGLMVKRFLGEAAHLARLRHPNIVSIHEVGRCTR